MSTDSTTTSPFNPQKILVAEFRYVAGSTVRGTFGSLYTVVDRDGYAFLACCTDHETAGTASGWYPCTNAGRTLADFEASDADLPANCGRQPIRFTSEPETTP